jgi:CheY-like chemotaxis protein
VNIERAVAVLLVARHDRDRERLREVLETRGASVQSADGADDAEAALDAWPAEVVVCAIAPWSDEADERGSLGALAQSRGIAAIALGGDACPGFTEVLGAPVDPDDVADAVLRLAAARRRDAFERAVAPDARDDRPPTILLVDDDDEIREALGELLSDEGYAVEQAEDGRAALHALERMGDARCLVLLDLMMPVMDGWELLRALDDAGRRVPVIAVSALGGIAPPGTAMMITKPASAAAIVGAVREAIAAYASG